MSESDKLKGEPLETDGGLFALEGKERFSNGVIILNLRRVGVACSTELAAPSRFLG